MPPIASDEISSNNSPSIGTVRNCTQEGAVDGNHNLQAHMYSWIAIDPNFLPATSTQAQVLLEALQNFIFPLVNATSGWSKYGTFRK
jgi:hypothetical protein